MDEHKRIVEKGYDAVAHRYSNWAQRDPHLRMEFVSKLFGLLSAGSHVLELGCGSGRPVTEALAQRFHVTGVDISATQLSLAQQHVPDASFIRADMSTVEFRPAIFDAVISLYSITHVPRVDHAGLLARIALWIQPGGYLLINMGAGDSPDSIEADWLGVPMFFSHFDAETNQILIKDAGFETLDAQVITEEEDGEQVRFLWVTATKPSGADQRPTRHTK